MKILSNLVIFVALATLFHQSSGLETDIREEILKAYEKAKDRLAPYGKSKSLVITSQMFERMASLLRVSTIICNNSCVNAFLKHNVSYHSVLRHICCYSFIKYIV